MESLLTFVLNNSFNLYEIYLKTPAAVFIKLSRILRSILNVTLRLID